jgi:histidinol-phosphatase
VAPSLIVREAGGLFTDLAGQDNMFGEEALADNGLLHARVLNLLQSASERS